MAHENVDQNEILTEHHESQDLIEENYFDKGYVQMGVDYITSKKFDQDCSSKIASAEIQKETSKNCCSKIAENQQKFKKKTYFDILISHEQMGIDYTTALRLEKNEVGHKIVKKPEPEKEKVRFSNVNKQEMVKILEKEFQG